MKILIISDDDSFISLTDEFFKNKEFDTIIYRWLLKALDNVEEIRPDVVLISASEYPRHWKTLTQFLKSGIGGNKIAIFLYEKDVLSQEDNKKVSLLGINGIINELTITSLEDIYKKIKAFFNDITNISPEVMMTNPKTRKIINGKLSSIGNNLFKITYDFSSDIKYLKEGDVINYITLSINNENITKSGIISKITNEDLEIELSE